MICKQSQAKKIVMKREENTDLNLDFEMVWLEEKENTFLRMWKK